MSFLDLPPELQAKILSNLVTSFGPSHIHRVLTVCKQIYSIALPLSVCIYRNTPELDIGGGNCSRRRNAMFLSYILVSKPELAKHVKAVIIGSTYSSEAARDPREIEVNCSTADELAQYEQQIRATMKPVTWNNEENALRCNQWIEDLRGGFSDAQLAFISLACPNLRLIFFEEPRKPRSFHFLLEMAPILSRSQKQGFSPLSKLEHAYYEPRTSRPGDSLFWTHAKLLMGLPRLRIYETVYIDGIDITESDFGQIPRRSSSLQEIVLHQSNCTPLMLQSMLGACKGLTKFEYSYYFSQEPRMIAARDVLEALLPHANTLTHLRFLLRSQRVKWWHQPEERVHMGSQLRQLTELRNLVVEMDSVTAIHPDPSEDNGAPRLVDCLPENLEYLQIQNCTISILGQAAELLRVIEQGANFKKLRRVRFIFDEEKINFASVDLVLNSPNTILEIVFHWHPQHFFDFGRSLHIPGRNMRTISSRIYAEDFRKQWIKFRGKLCARSRQYEIKMLEHRPAGIVNEVCEPESWAWLADSGLN